MRNMCCYPLWSSRSLLRFDQVSVDSLHIVELRPGVAQGSDDLASGFRGLDGGFIILCEWIVTKTGMNVIILLPLRVGVQWISRRDHSFLKSQSKCYRHKLLLLCNRSSEADQSLFGFQLEEEDDRLK